MTFEKVKSADGTTIAFETTGEGPALILVGGAFCDRTAHSSGTPLAALLAHRFTVFSYDRRGRGDSGNGGAPYTTAREVEDLAAVLEAAGGSASVFGNSSGGLLALDAALAGLSIDKLIIYEPPVILDSDRAQAFIQLAHRLDEAASAGRRSEAVELYFSQVMQMPETAIAQARSSAVWPGLERLAHTLSYDLRITAAGAARLERLPGLHVPTQVMDGGSSPLWLREAIRTLAAAIPKARHHTLEGQTHAVDPRLLSRALEHFVGE